MKVKMIMLSLLISLSGQAANTYRISGIKPYLRDRVYLLVNRTPDLLVLDCSSFLHNLTIASRGHEFIHYLTVEECAEFHHFFRGLNLKRKCLTDHGSEVTYHYCH
jgi:hypothetical protein